MEPLLIYDSQSGSSASIAAHLGWNCYQFQAVTADGRTIQVLDAADDFAAGNERPSGHGIPILFPFPNRIRNGRMRWNGKEYYLPNDAVRYDATGNAIHGFCLDRPWRLVQQTESSVTGEFQLSIDAPERLSFWPADFIIRIQYLVQTNPATKTALLVANITVQNPSETSLPWGFGTHPYFRLPLSPKNSSEGSPIKCLIEAPVCDEWELVDCLPTGKRRPIPAAKNLRDALYFGSFQLDDAFTLRTENDDDETASHETAITECLILDESTGLQVSQRFGPEYRELVVFTPPNRNAICLEPYTCVTDAANLQPNGIDAGWNSLEPGGTFQSQIIIEAGPVFA